MSNRDINNARADAIADQVMAHIRDGKQIPGNLDVVLAAIRVDLPDCLSEETRDMIRSVQKSWSDEFEVDIVG